ncbi:MAG: DUF4382 domain-containing protein [Spirochaetales bacterium]|nr:DUF4382 domain-containing protein [Spirochaetales bacterium]
MTDKKGCFIIPVVLSICLLTAASCLPPLELPASFNTGEVEVLLTGNASYDTMKSLIPGIEGIWISIARVEAHNDDGTWRTIVDNGGEGMRFNLIDIACDIAVVGIGVLETGLYTQLRLVLDNDNSIDIVENELLRELPLAVPGGSETGIKLVTSFEVTRAARLNIVLSFNPEKSLVAMGNDRFRLQPVFEIETISPVAD